ncbi:MAG: DUF721 domain-containing protein, partial [Spirochaetaceae bacterium]|nr:DUF721 domain-containing protein [Spirochaetaceae bacterium]
AMHVFPRDIINNVLVLETDHPLWSQQIRMRQEGLLKIIRGKYPSLEIKRFRVVIGKKDNKAAIIKNNSLPDKDIPVPKKEVNDKEAEPFFELLETMRRRGDS